MMQDAIDRLQERSRAAGRATPDLDEMRAAKGNLGAGEISGQLAAADIPLHDDAVTLFSIPPDGWQALLDRRFMTLKEALSERDDLRMVAADIIGYDVPLSWLPFHRDSIETFILDTETGAVLHLDLVDGLREFAPSMEAWIDDEVERLLGDPATAKHRPPKLVAPPATQSASTFVPSAIAPRQPQTATATAWRPPSGQIAGSRLRPDGTVAVVVDDTEGSAVYVMDPARPGDRAEPIARCPERSTRVPLISEDGSTIVVNRTWIGPLDGSTSLTRLPGPLAPNVSMSADGRHVMCVVDDTWMLVDATSGQSRPVGERSVLVGDHYVSSVNGGQTLVLHHRISGDGHKIPASAVGFTAFSNAAWLFPHGDRVLLRSKDGEGLAMYDPAVGSVQRLTDQNVTVLGISRDGSAVFAKTQEYPATRCLRIDTRTGVIHVVASRRPDDGQTVLSEDDSLLAQHCVSANGQLGVEIVTLATGGTQRFDLTAKLGADLFYALWLTPECVVFDNRQQNRPHVIAAPLVDGRVVRADPLDSAHPLIGRIEVLGSMVAWPVSGGLLWSYCDGTGPLMHFETDRRHMHLTENGLVVNERDRLAILPHPVRG